VLALRDDDVFKIIFTSHTPTIRTTVSCPRRQGYRDVVISQGTQDLEAVPRHWRVRLLENGGEKPVTGNLVTEALYAALDLIGVEDRAERNVTFHSCALLEYGAPCPWRS